MSYTVGDGSVVLALAAGVVGYVYVKHQSRRRRLEIIHQERLVAMEKGIPLPEFPPEPARNPYVLDPNVLPILGTVLVHHVPNLHHIEKQGAFGPCAESDDSGAR